MAKTIMEASHAVSEAVRMAKPAVVAAYPITPQTHIVERLSEFAADGTFAGKYIRAESEFGAISACLGSSATGVRTYTSTSSQGLALMHEILYVISGMRLPVCMTVANRALSAPINIWNDHQDSMAERDAGWVQMYAETAQECYDLTLMQFRISEHKDVLTPSMVCLDGFTLSHVYEPVNIPDQKDVDGFLPAYRPQHAVLDPKQPLTLGAIGFPSHYMEFRKSQSDAIANSSKVIGEVYREFSKMFPVEVCGSRPGVYNHVEQYKMGDAETVFVAMGSVCGTIKDVVDGLRRKGEKAGLMKLVTFRPFPAEEIKKSLKNIKNIAVVEKAIAPGANPPLYDEVRSLLYDSENRPKVGSYVVGLGGRDVRVEHIEKIYKTAKSGNAGGWMF